MLQTNISNWIVNNPQFKENYNYILLESVKMQFNDILDINSETRNIDWGYLLFCASILSKSGSISNTDKALRIAQSCISSSASPEHKDMATIILNSLVNIPAIELAIKRNLIEHGIEKRLNTPSLLHWKRNEYESTIETNSGEKIFANSFQNKFWESLENNQYVSITAPTAAGKTFITKQWIVNKIQENEKINIVYIVPTRALIYQLEEDFKHLIAENGLENKVNVASMPLHEALDWNKSNIFVFTQERFYILLSSLNFKLNLFAMIIDEAYKIEDENRGLLLQQIIEWGFSESVNPEIVFISPFTENPEKFLEDSSESNKSNSFISNEVTVNQNILWAIQKRNSSKNWELNLINDSEEHHICDFNLHSTPDSGIKRISYIVNALTNKNTKRSKGNIIYVNGAADAEKVARHLFDLFDNKESQQPHPELKSLIGLCKKTIHKDYVLCKVLAKGIAFHYGNMPILIKSEIERLFNDNIITHLVCTSTLVEGVNMSCRTIFMRGPEKGQRKLMTNADFWNLAGRAGRWGKEFQGNIICIDPRDNKLWIEGEAPKKRSHYYIKKFADNIQSKASEFLEYIKNLTTNTERNFQFDQFISYLLIQYRRHGTIKKYAWSNSYPNIDAIEEEISKLSNDIGIPSDIIENNPGINPVYMVNLFNYFKDREKFKDKNIEHLLLCDPASEEAIDIYNKVLQRINSNLTKIAVFPTLLYSYSIVVINWMKGYPLSRIIAERIKYLKKKNRSYKLDTIIRETMSIIEEVARYKAPKYFKCYSDVLTHYLRSTERNDLISAIKDFSVFLEFGVSQQSQLSLLYLGFSRTAVSYISEYMTEDSLNKEQCIEWFETHSDWINYDIPDKIKDDINSILAKIKNQNI